MTMGILVQWPKAQRKIISTGPSKVQCYPKVQCYQVLPSLQSNTNIHNITNLHSGVLLMNQCGPILSPQNCQGPGQSLQKSQVYLNSNSHPHLPYLRLNLRLPNSLNLKYPLPV